ncbi:hypothetical protein CDAR_180591 [Caerostris darwini]|uniref:Uncharacterized protein n=1 Tax=Caerostris darwini TaxID=1538125 RepID=A0AAV4UGI9_9ARAC|nr:hypothetical protein CDAR_180591 [Caerostris darwini]
MFFTHEKATGPRVFITACHENPLFCEYRYNLLKLLKLQTQVQSELSATKYMSALWAVKSSENVRRGIVVQIYVIFSFRGSSRQFFEVGCGLCVVFDRLLQSQRRCVNKFRCLLLRYE